MGSHVVVRVEMVKILGRETVQDSVCPAGDDKAVGLGKEKRTGGQ